MQTIVLAGIPLPTIDVPTVINGRSQGGVSYTGSPKIAICGVAVPNVNGITVDSNAAGSTIEGLSIVGFVASARTGTLMKGAAIYIAPGSNGNLIQGNYLGYIPGGDIGTPNDYGIDISSSNNTIGGTAAGAANLISGNKVGGIALLQAENASLTGLGAVANNVIEGNLIGTSPNGTSALVNGGPLPEGTSVPLGFGIGLAGATNTTIGGTTAAARNVIAGNHGSGIEMTAFIKDLSDYDPGSGAQLATTGNLVIGNYIGVSAASTAGLANEIGVLMSDAADNTVGGTVAGARAT